MVKVLCCSFPVLFLAITGCSSGNDGDSYRVAAQEAAGQIDRAWIQSRLEALASDEMEGRDNLSAGGQRAREYLVAELQQVGVEPLGDAWEQPFEQGKNVIGVIAGNDPILADEVVVLGAHYDHLGQCSASSDEPGDTICNGASDNASGCAAVLAIVRAVVQSSAGLRRSLVVAFWDAEEDGLYGSKHFVNSGVVPADDISAMVNLDTLATEIFSGYSIFFALGTEYSDQLRQHVTANPHAGSTPFYAVSEFFSGGGAAGRGDHVPFRDAQIPFVWFSSGAPESYHTAADEIDKVDVELLTQMTRQMMLTIADIANAAQRPSFIPEPRPHLDDARAMVEIGEAVKKDPSAVGLDPNNSLLMLLDGLLKKLRDYIDKPPMTQEEWDAYRELVESIISTFYMTMGR